jgi:hypothetical protein
MLNGNDLELLSAYLDGALSEAERRALETRLQSDAELRRELARLRATVDLIKTLPTLTTPRPLTLTPRMVRRPNILTSAAFSALSAAAAIILLVIGAGLFTRPPSAAPDDFAARSAVAFAPTTSAINEPAQGGANNAIVPPDMDNFQSTLEKSSTEIGLESTTGLLGFAAPTATAQPTIVSQLYAAPLTQGTSAGEELPADASVAQSQQAQPSPDDQLRTQSELAAPSSALDGAGVDAAQAPLPAPTLLTPRPTLAPTRTASAVPSDTPSPTETATPTNTPSPTASALPTLVPTPILTETPATETNVVGIGLIAVALVLFGLAIVTTILRRRS